MLISVEDLRKAFRGPDGSVARAVDGVSFGVAAGETLGLVGESGCGKSTVGRCLLRLTDPDEGTITFDGTRIERMSQRELRSLRQRMQIVFQDPLGSTNPAFTLRQTLGDALRQAGVERAQRERRVRDLLDSVGLSARLLDRRRDELSGGQLQRGAVARALAPQPEFVFLDEPTSSLDLSVRGQIINLLADLQDEFGHAYLFASHDLSVVRVLAHRVIVMYRGRIVESGPTAAILSAPAHPYTQALLEAAGDDRAPQAVEHPGSPSDRLRTTLRDDPDAPASALDEQGVSGCRYQPRCPFRHERCVEEPDLMVAGEGNRHIARCWLVEPEDQPGRTQSASHGRSNHTENPSQGVL